MASDDSIATRFKQFSEFQVRDKSVNLTSKIYACEQSRGRNNNNPELINESLRLNPGRKVSNTFSHQFWKFQLHADLLLQVHKGKFEQTHAKTLVDVVRCVIHVTEITCALFKCLAADFFRCWYSSRYRLYFADNFNGLIRLASLEISIHTVFWSIQLF